MRRFQYSLRPTRSPTAVTIVANPSRPTRFAFVEFSPRSFFCFRLGLYPSLRLCPYTLARQHHLRFCIGVPAVEWTTRRLRLRGGTNRLRPPRSFGSFFAPTANSILFSSSSSTTTTLLLVAFCDNHRTVKRNLLCRSV